MKEATEMHVKLRLQIFQLLTLSIMTSEQGPEQWRDRNDIHVFMDQIGRWGLKPLHTLDCCLISFKQEVVYIAKQL